MVSILSFLLVLVIVLGLLYVTGNLTIRVSNVKEGNETIKELHIGLFKKKRVR